MNLEQQRFRTKLEKLKRELDVHKDTLQNLDCEFANKSPVKESKSLVNVPSTQSFLQAYDRKKNDDVLPQKISNNIQVGEQSFDQELTLGSMLQYEKDNDFRDLYYQMSTQKIVDFQSFRVKEGKQTEHIKKFTSPIRVLPPPDEPTIAYSHVEHLEPNKFYLMNYNSSKHSLTKRSSSERSQSRIAQMLNRQIESPALEESSFLRDGLRQKRSTKIEEKSIIGTQDQYIADDNESEKNVLSKNLFDIKRSSKSVSKTTILSPQDDKDKRLMRDISKETNIFERQKRVIEYVEQNMDKKIDLDGLFQYKRKSRQSQITKSPYTVLKTERIDSSIIQQIQPTFPLKQEVNYYEQIQTEKDDEMKIKIADIIKSGNPLENFLKDKKTVEQLYDYEQAGYRIKLNDMNQFIDGKLKNVEKKFLDDDYIYEKFQNQINNKAKVKGKKIYTNKDFSGFQFIKWPKLTDVTDH